MAVVICRHHCPLPLLRHVCSNVISFLFIGISWRKHEVWVDTRQYSGGTWIVMLLMLLLSLVANHLPQGAPQVIGWILHAMSQLFLFFPFACTEHSVVQVQGTLSRQHRYHTPLDGCWQKEHTSRSGSPARLYDEEVKFQRRQKKVNHHGILVDLVTSHRFYIMLPPKTKIAWCGCNG